MGIDVNMEIVSQCIETLSGLKEEVDSLDISSSMTGIGRCPDEIRTLITNLKETYKTNLHDLISKSYDFAVFKQDAIIQADTASATDN